MKKFEQGKTYYTRSICNQDCIFSYTIKKRTQKSAVLIDYFGDEIRRKIKENNGVEYIEIEQYSMAPVIHADREYIAG
jgi:hypothetical protein